MNFKGNIYVKDMTSGEPQKRSSSVLLVSIKYLTVVSKMIVL